MLRSPTRQGILAVSEAMLKAVTDDCDVHDFDFLAVTIEAIRESLKRVIARKMFKQLIKEAKQQWERLKTEHNIEVGG